ncbi:hypothetical protein SAMD00019534_121820 [Acytostelium subglobosum LB1]|uniref:hypothetical protein n=1 Tax=Acytostelium subglobosum LB1 TaxID=1410327 RepID=UPI000644E833|nr:hypothetical protein SAMD00019534_121820 [Acytostelium subglobosum LB1]GAM29006.1 hypothetical protein SAMD00019534_121820 [Acytostelium subglobosum LB1]|eukprot:XP_012748012.1 hypothetical protein SAMD00019534_121820 [Acytostelium subglobosum LB1]
MSMKDKAREFLQHSPVFKSGRDLPPMQYKDLVLEQLKAIAKSGLYDAQYVRDRPDITFILADVFSSFNNNIVTKFGAQYGLFCGSLLMLGTERHQHLLELGNKIKAVGSFSMTEVGHGSNVQALQTTARYKADTQEFIIDTPTPMSEKYWIGGAGVHAHYTTIFARLIDAQSIDRGVHAFVVQLRDVSTNAPMPGIQIKECGMKLGLNGVDNGHIKVTNVRIPRVNLLNKFSDVNEKGEYTSKFRDPLQNFAATLAPFVSGRVFVATIAGGAMKTCLAIAIRYSHYRKQFGPDLKNELPIITLPSQQRRLFVPLANLIIMDMYNKKMVELLMTDRNGATQVTHAHCAGIKALFSWESIKAFQTCREACGGQGFRLENRIAEFKSDSDITATYEGDNTVLMQQVAKYAMSASKKSDEAVVPVSFKGDARQELYNFNNLLALFKARKQLKLSEARQLVSLPSEGGKYEAYTKAIPWLVSAGFAHMEYEIIDNAVKVIKQDTVAPVPQLLLLFALTKIEDDLGWFVSNELLPNHFGRVIKYLIVDLCKDITPHSMSIVNSFAIPPKCTPSESLTDGIWSA